MMKSSGESAFGQFASQQASAAMEAAADELVMRKYLLDRRPKEKDDVDNTKAPVIKSGQDDLQAQRVDTEKEGGDADYDSFEDEEDAAAFAEFRARRMAEFREVKKKEQQVQIHGHGEYSEIVEEEFLPTTTRSKHVVCHFYHRDFERCLIVDKHLHRLAPDHSSTRFVKINAEKSPFFVAKLAIRMLPTIVIFREGFAVDRIVGFEELGGKDDFSTLEMAKRLYKAGAIELGGKRMKKELPSRRIKTLEGDL